MIDLGQLLVAGVFFMPVVMGLVEWIKKLGLNTKLLPFVSMGIGLILGGGYYIAEYGLSVDFAGWFGCVIFGLTIGLSASGVYDVATK